MFGMVYYTQQTKRKITSQIVGDTELWCGCSLWRSKAGNW